MDQKVESRNSNEYFDNEKAAIDEDISIRQENEPFVKSIEERAFVRKLNWTVLPVIFLIVFIQVNIFKEERKHIAVY